jgi:hypothetical protein
MLFFDPKVFSFILCDLWLVKTFIFSGQNGLGIACGRDGAIEILNSGPASDHQEIPIRNDVTLPVYPAYNGVLRMKGGPGNVQDI